MLKAIKGNPNDWSLFSRSDKRFFRHFLDFDDDDDDVDSEDFKVFDVDGKMTRNGETMECLSEQAQLLFVRLFQRKHRWLRRDQIKYEVLMITVVLLP